MKDLDEQFDEVMNDPKYKLAADDIQSLQYFNNLLAALEKKIIKEVNSLHESGQQRTKSPSLLRSNIYNRGSIH